METRDTDLSISVVCCSQAKVWYMVNPTPRAHKNPTNIELCPHKVKYLAYGCPKINRLNSKPVCLSRYLILWARHYRCVWPQGSSYCAMPQYERWANTIVKEIRYTPQNGSFNKANDDSLDLGWFRGTLFLPTPKKDIYLLGYIEKGHVKFRYWWCGSIWGGYTV